ncbi:hypothetical protein PTNB29_03354 [Pyrenophora teres f. teres]|nr:hypothetical protein PTNB29_03354 [Pyrenophora teres f. teres]
MASTNVAAKNPASKPKDAEPKLKDSDTGRIKDRLECGATTAEIATEAYRVCHINALLRRDLHQAHKTIRSNCEAAKKQVVQEDALNEMREELLPTRKLVDRFWNLLGQRKVKVPEDLRASYFALKSMSPDDLEPKKAAEKLKAAVKPLNKAQQRTARKKERERKEREANGTTLFLLHDLDGETYDARKPIAIVEESEEEGEIVDDVEDEDMTVEDAAAIEHANFMKNGSSWRPRILPVPKSVPEKVVAPPVVQPSELVAHNVVAGVKRKADDSEPVTAAKMPRIEEDTKTNKVAGVKRKAEDSESFTATKKPRLEDDAKTDDAEREKRKAEEDANKEGVEEEKLNAEEDAKTNDAEGEKRKAENEAKADGVKKRIER